METAVKVSNEAILEAIKVDRGLHLGELITRVEEFHGLLEQGSLFTPSDIVDDLKSWHLRVQEEIITLAGQLEREMGQACPQCGSRAPALEGFNQRSTIHSESCRDCGHVFMWGF